LLLDDPDAIGRSRQSLDTTLKRYAHEETQS
jgi:hypothetical protein